MQNYEQTLLKNPEFEQSFRTFVSAHDGKEETKRASSIIDKSAFDINDHLREKIRKEDEDFMVSSYSNSLLDEDDKYNDLMF
jgi:hypothetical protein